MPEEENIYATGAEESPLDLRTFTYEPDTARIKGGQRYQPKDIEDQHKVGICTSISVTQNAKKALGTEFSADFQYLMQKKFYDKNWNEGSSAFHSLKAAAEIGLLPASEWKHTTESDRKLGYEKYIKKLQAVSEKEIERLKAIAANYKISGYAKVPVDRDMLANAIDESRAGIICRYVLGKEWWTKPIEPIQKAQKPISGHLVTVSNYDGNSFRIANSWGIDWADKGTGYHLLTQYQPTEAWIIYYKDLPYNVEIKKLELESLNGQILTLLQQVVKLLQLKVKAK